MKTGLCIYNRVSQAQPAAKRRQGKVVGGFTGLQNEARGGIQWQKQSIV